MSKKVGVSSTYACVCQYIKKHANLILLTGIVIANASLMPNFNPLGRGATPAIVMPNMDVKAMTEMWRDVIKQTRQQNDRRELLKNNEEK